MKTTQIADNDGTILFDSHILMRKLKIIFQTSGILLLAEVGTTQIGCMVALLSL